MSTYGNDINETIGIITAGTEVMVGQPAKVARGWRTIGANIVNLADETDRWTAANGKVDVALKNSQGELRSTYDILKDLQPQWEGLSKKEKSSLALSIAGRVVLAQTHLFRLSTGYICSKTMSYMLTGKPKYLYKAIPWEYNPVSTIPIAGSRGAIDKHCEVGNDIA